MLDRFTRIVLPAEHGSQCPIHGLRSGDGPLSVRVGPPASSVTVVPLRQRVSPGLAAPGPAPWGLDPRGGSSLAGYALRWQWFPCIPSRAAIAGAAVWRQALGPRRQRRGKGKSREKAWSGEGS
jgi:hypothetical protein